MEVRILDHFKLSNAVIAARTCWNSFHKGGNYREPTDNISEADKELLQRLLFKDKHTSISEHCYLLISTDSTFLYEFFNTNAFSTVTNDKDRYIICTNLRVLLENTKQLKHNIIRQIIPEQWRFLFKE